MIHEVRQGSQIFAELSAVFSWEQHLSDSVVISAESTGLQCTPMSGNMMNKIKPNGGNVEIAWTIQRRRSNLEAEDAA